ncbi:MAG: hypothetical protein WAK71_09895, partial [Streptosporangiaceae bacterium]
ACAATGAAAAIASPAAAAVMTIVGNFLLMYIPPDSDLSYFERTRSTGGKSLDRQGDSHERGESAKSSIGHSKSGQWSELFCINLRRTISAIRQKKDQNTSGFQFSRMPGPCVIATCQRPATLARGTGPALEADGRASRARGQVPRARCS